MPFLSAIKHPYLCNEGMDGAQPATSYQLHACDVLWYSYVDILQHAPLRLAVVALLAESLVLSAEVYRRVALLYSGVRRRAP